MSQDDWFADGADARRYLAEVGRLWLIWLVGLGALALGRGLIVLVIGVGLLVVMFMMMSPLQDRVQARFGDGSSARETALRRTLSARDSALRQLTYGTRPFAEAVEKAGLPRALNLVPWLVIVATLVVAAFVAVAWFDS